MKRINHLTLTIKPFVYNYPYNETSVQYELEMSVDGNIVKSVRLFKEIEPTESELEHFSRILTAQLYEAYKSASTSPIDKWDKTLSEIQHKTTHTRI